jgi:hypothetical protein
LKLPEEAQGGVVTRLEDGVVAANGALTSIRNIPT